MSGDNEHTKYDHLNDEKLQDIVTALIEGGHIHKEVTSEFSIGPITLREGGEDYSLTQGYHVGSAPLATLVSAGIDLSEISSVKDVAEAVEEAEERGLVAPIAEGHSKGGGRDL